MKRLCLILTIILVISCTGCGSFYEKTKVPFPTADNSSSSSAVEDIGYKQIATREITDFRTVVFTHPVGSVEFKVPSDWDILLGENGDYSVKRGGRVIGSVSKNSPELPYKTYEKKMLTINQSHYTYIYAIYQYGTGDEAKFYHYFSFNLKAENNTYRTVMMIDYAEINPDGAQQIVRSMVPSVDSNYKPLNIMNGSKKILLAGNMNITGSKMAQFLRDFLSEANPDYTVEIQNYHDGDSLKDWESSDQLKKVKDGEYCIVILTSFTDYADVDAFKEFYNACNSHSIAVSVMKTHIDSDRVMKPLTDKYLKAVNFIDMKTELEALITAGVLKSSLYSVYSNGKHNYEAAAGYVGAMMIYEEIFKQTPPKISSSASAGQFLSIAQNALGNYANHGNAGTVKVDSYRTYYPF